MFAKVITAVMILITCMPLHVLPTAQALSSVASSMGRIKGKVLFRRGDGVELGERDVIVVFESGQTKRKANVDDAGNYQIDLPAGVYQVTLESWQHYPFRRASFRVQPDTVTMLNVVPVTYSVLSVTTDLSGKSKGPRPSRYEKTPFKYDSFSILHKAGAPSDMLIRFFERRQRKGILEYGVAMASYDVFAIYASKLRFDPQTLRLEAEGDVVVEDGKQRVQVNRAEVSFKAGEPILSLTR